MAKVLPRRQFLPHQEEAYLQHTPLDRMCLFMDMRLGKSMVAIRWLKFKGPVMVLVIAPTTPLLDWRTELVKERIGSIRLNSSVLDWQYKRLCERQGSYWALATYELVRSNKKILRLGWDAVILDESTAIKNPKAAITKRLLRWSKNHPETIKACLSGLPAPQDLTELWPQMAFTFAGSWMKCSNFYRWRDVNFYEGAPHDFYPKKKGEPIRKQFHEDSFVLTREECDDPGPEINHHPLYEKPDRQLVAIQDQIMNDWEAAEATTMWAMTVTGWLQDLAGGFMPMQPGDTFKKPMDCWKYDALEDINKTWFHNKQFVVWCVRKNEVERIKYLFGDNAVTLTGDLNSEIRYAHLSHFRNGLAKILIATVQCAKRGLDLSCADGMVYFSRTWSYDDRKQSMERCRHPKRKDPILVVDLITENTIDVAILEALDEHQTDARWLMSRMEALT